jgi:hypothetical protein
MMSLKNKIRVWCKTTEHFTDCPFLGGSGHHLLWMHTGNETSLTRTDDEDYIIHRYTEFDDINGKPVYQGDIVSMAVYDSWGDEHRHEIIQLVEWSRSSLGWRTFSKKMWKAGMNGNVFGSELTIIGNICQNPEILP